MNLPEGCHPQCPACAHRDWTVHESLTQKAQWLAQRLAPWSGQLSPVRSVAEAERWGYRDRVSLSARWQNGRWHFGVMRRDELIPIPDCPVHSERVRAVVAVLSSHLPSPERFRLAYLVQSGAQVVLVLKQKHYEGDAWFSAALTEALARAGIEGLWLHCFPAAGRHLFAKNGWQLLWGRARSRDAHGAWYGPGAFTQLLDELHRASLNEAQAFLSPQAGDWVVDLYCGRGLSLQRWQAQGARCLGVELGAEALACAALNVPEARLLRGACAQRLPQIEAWWHGVGKEHRLIYLNPPRTGLEAEVVQWLIAQGRPARLAYLSCSAGTLARDLDVLCRGGYRVKQILPYDFFPQTYHVETLALLSHEG